MSKLSRIVGIISIWLLGILPVLSQNLYLKGTVADESSGNPIPFVTVSVSSTPSPVESGMDGTFAFNNLSEGRQIIQFFASGYENLIIEREVLSPGVDLGTVRLKPAQSGGIADLMVWLWPT